MTQGYNATTISKEPCRAIFSIQEYVPINCDGLERQPLSDNLCHRNDVRPGSKRKKLNTTLYKVTLGYRFRERVVLQAKPPRLSAYSCDINRHFFNFNTRGTACYPLEYVAVSFSKNDYLLSPSNQTEENPFYICILGEQRVEGWKQTPDGRSRISFSEPYINSPPGVFWSTVMKPDGEDTMFCSFIIDTKTQTYSETQWRLSQHNIQLGAPKKFFYMGDFDADQGWYVKMSFGRIERDTIPGGGMNSYIKKVDLAEKNQFVVAGRLLKKDIKDATRQPNVAGVTLKPPIQAHLDKLASVYKACRDNRALCYILETEASCIHREKCHALMSIRDNGIDFTDLHIDLVSHHKEIPGTIIPTSPFGWVCGILIRKDMYLRI